VGTSLLEIALSAWMSASSFAGSPRWAFALTRNVAAPAVVLFRSSLVASHKMSASGAHDNVAIPPSSIFLQLSAALGCMDFVTGVPHNAKTKAAISGRFELNSSSSRPALLCCLFLFFCRFAYLALISLPFLVRSITRCDFASEAVAP